MAIPKIFHHLWLTDASNSTDFARKYVKDVVSFKKQVAKQQHWQHILWINTPKENIPDTIKLAKELEVEVRQLSTLTTNYQDLLDLVVAFQVKSKSTIPNLIDTAKYLVAEAEGGFVMDLNYNLVNTLPNEVADRFSLLYQHRTLENSFFGVTPHSRVMINILDEMHTSSKFDFINNDETSYSSLTSWTVYQKEIQYSGIATEEVLGVGGRALWCGDYIPSLYNLKEYVYPQYDHENSLKLPSCPHVFIIGADHTTMFHEYNGH